MPETHPLRIHVHLPRRISRGYMELTRACGDNDSNGDFAVGLYGRAPTVCVTERVLNVCCWHPGPVCPIGGRCRALLLPEAYKCRDVACALGTWTQAKFNLSIQIRCTPGTLPHAHQPHALTPPIANVPSRGSTSRLLWSPCTPENAPVQGAHNEEARAQRVIATANQRGAPILASYHYECSKHTHDE